MDLHAARPPEREAGDDLIELLFFAYRDFVGDPDRILSQYGFGRAHHRVLHFVGRYPGLTIAELLDILRITKQSLNRVLKDLIEQGYILQRPGTSDRRQRLLHCSDSGARLAGELNRVQIRRVTRALTDQACRIGSGETEADIRADARRSAEDFLFAMIEPRERAAVHRLMARRAPGDQAEAAAPVELRLGSASGETAAGPSPEGAAQQTLRAVSDCSAIGHGSKTVT